MFGASDKAAAQTDALPDYFVRVTSLSEITEDDVYVIGATYERDGRFFLMSNQASGNNLKAIQQNGIDASAAMLECDDSKCLWRFSPKDNGHFEIKSHASGLSLYNAKSTNLTLTAKSGTAWSIGNGEGYSFDITANDRNLSLYVQDVSVVKFGNYKSYDSKALYLYKGVKASLGDDDKAVPMTDGSKTCLYTKGYIATAGFSTLSDNGLRLADGTVAPDDAIGLWTYGQLPDSCFTLTGADGKYLGYDFAPAETPVVWRMSQGYIMTAESPPRILCLGSAFLLKSRAELKFEAPIRLRTIGEAPTKGLIGGSRLVLHGAWGADRLAALDWESATSLDLTGISLPVSGLSQAGQRPTDTNTFIYVAATATSLIPSSWKAVVASDGEALAMLTECPLIDRQSLVPDTKISYAASQLSYSRNVHADGNWETLVLPFSATLPQGFTAQALRAFQDGELCFDETAEIPAYTPVIIRYAGPAVSAETVRFTVQPKTDGQLLPASTTAAGIFTGTFAPMNIASASEHIYLLNDEGTTFVLADTGSGLAPFRAYVNVNDARGAIRLVTDWTATAIDTATQTNGEKTGSAYYYIDGRRTTKRPAKGQIHIVPGKGLTLE